MLIMLHHVQRDNITFNLLVPKKRSSFSQEPARRVPATSSFRCLV